MPPGPTDERDAAHMRRALALAERGRATVAPNPLVGCVVVRGGNVVGEGWHERAGGPHAEVVALAAAGEAALGATAYVTLEPCAHTGRTPPCTQALLAAGVARVVAAVADPHPLAAGGADVLRAAGVQMDVGVAEAEARRQNEVFLHHARTGRPFLIAKAAVSLDGRIAAADGTSRWLTGAGTRALAHRLRAAVGAVVVGSGTVLADDPQLTVRLPDHAGPQPLRVVLDRRARTLDGAPWRVYDGTAPTLVVTAPAAAPAALLPDVEHAVAEDLAGALAVLADRHVTSALLEGGAGVLGAAVSGGLVDKLVVHAAPLLLGERGRPLLAADGIGTLGAAPRFTLDAVEPCGDDVVATYYPRREAA